MRAFAALRADGLEHRLLLAGADAGEGAALHGDGVELLGYVDDARLDALLRGAAALVHPSLYEGFGLVVLEAMARGTPGGGRRATALPETAGGAAALCDPLDPADIARAIRAVLDDPRAVRGARARAGGGVLVGAHGGGHARGLRGAPVSTTVLMLSVDEAQLLRHSLPAAVAQADVVVVIDNACTDGTAALARAHGAEVVALTPRRSYAAAMNAGIAASGGDAVLLLNADCVLEPGFIAAARARLDADPGWARSRPSSCVPPASGPAASSARSTRPG